MMRIRCALCQTPVVQVTTEYDRLNMQWVITAFCHGQQDAMTLHEGHLQEVRDMQQQLQTQEGIAFRQDLIEARP
jgi:hypothetical protein